MILNNGEKDVNLDITNENCKIEDVQALCENMFYDMVASMPEEARKSFLESDECKEYLEENGGFVGRKTLVRLNKIDDLSRRIKLAVYQKAKEDGDPNYRALKKLQLKKHKLNEKLMTKYANRVKADAVRAQRALIKINPQAFTKPIR